MSRLVHTIDATNIAPGRLATKIAILLMGKHKPSYTPHKDEGDMVVIENTANMKMSKQFLERKVYHKHSLYPGGLKTTQAKNVLPKDILYRAVYNMLPKNKLRAKVLKRLTIQ